MARSMALPAERALHDQEGRVASNEHPVLSEQVPRLRSSA